MTLGTQTAVNNITAFTAGFNVLAGTSKSYLEKSKCISMEVIDGKQKMQDFIGKVAMQEADEVNTRVKETSVDHTRRRLMAKRYNAAIQVDEKVVRDMGKDPKTAYAQRLVDACNREKDQVIAKAMFADVYTGEFGTVAVTFANDGGRTVDATAGMTYEKIVEIQQKQSAKATGVMHEEMAELWLSDQEMADLLKDEKMINNDYGRMTKVDGKHVIESLGIEIGVLASEVDDELPVLEVSGGVRNCFALAGTKAKPALYYSVRKNMSVQVKDNSHEFVEGRQIQATMEIGATRAEGVRVIKVTTTPTA